jgi:hypothetical protein
MFLSPKQAAARACVSVGLIYAWCQSGQLSHLRVGAPGRRGKILIDPCDLEAALAAFRVADRPSLVPHKHPPRGGFKHLRLG